MNPTWICPSVTHNFNSKLGLSVCLILPQCRTKFTFNCQFMQKLGFVASSFNLIDPWELLPAFPLLLPAPHIKHEWTNMSFPSLLPTNIFHSSHHLTVAPPDAPPLCRTMKFLCLLFVHLLT